jgi:hypothetical protein
MSKLASNSLHRYTGLQYLQHIYTGLQRLRGYMNYYCARAYGLGSQCRPNECIFGSGKPRGLGFRVGGYMSQVRKWGS